MSNKKPSISDFTRKSVVGAFYRVGASFTMDALYLSLVGAASYYLKENQELLQGIYTGFSDFVSSLDPGKLARVAGFVVAINFADYKWDITERLDKAVRRISGLERKASNDE